MKDYWLKIKIADLLNNPWNSDNIDFENKYLKEIDFNLKKPWISWKVFLQWLSKDEVLVKIKELKFKVSYQCDKCLEKYDKEYKLEDLEDVRFVNTEELPIEEKIYDTVFPIDMKNQSIDLSWLIEIIIKNQEPVIKNCWKHKEPEEIEEIENQEKNNQLTINLWDLLKSKKNVKK